MEKNMTYEEAYNLALKSKWKTENCGQDDCWCSMITTEKSIKYDENEEVYIVSAGAINKELAKHIVELQNKNLIVK